MSAESQVFQALVSDPFVKSIIDARVFANIAPQDQPTPYIVFTREDSQPTYTIDGNRPEGAERVLLGVYCFAKTQQDADDLATVAQEALAMRGVYHQRRSSGYDYETDQYATQLVVAAWE